MSKMKIKHFQTDSVKMKDSNKGIISGYASQFMNVDSYGDRVFPEAFNKTLEEGRSRPVRMRWNHHGPIIGKWTSLGVDEHGLYTEGGLTPNHSVAEDTKASILHEAIDGMSIGYREIRTEKNEFGGVDIFELELVEISIVEEPANLGASIHGMKSAIEELTSLKEIESFIRDECGLSRTATKALISRIKNQRDVGLIDCSELIPNIKF